MWHRRRENRGGEREKETKKLKGSMVTHRPANVPKEKCPPQCLGGLVTGIDDARDVVHLNLPVSSPLLNGKVLDVNVARARSRPALVDHSGGSLVIDVEGRWLVLKKA